MSSFLLHIQKFKRLKKEAVTQITTSVIALFSKHE